MTLATTDSIFLMTDSKNWYRESVSECSELLFTFPLPTACFFAVSLLGKLKSSHSSASTDSRRGAPPFKSDFEAHTTHSSSFGCGANRNGEKKKNPPKKPSERRCVSKHPLVYLIWLPVSFFHFPQDASSTISETFSTHIPLIEQLQTLQHPPTPTLTP